MKTKKDKLFIIVLSIVAANVSYHLIKTMQLITSGWWTKGWLWFLISVDAIAIAGVLWLLKNYRLRRRIEKEAETAKAKL